jgi:hypothetical protein
MAGSIVDIEGVGHVEFPDGMKPEEISAASHRLYTGAGAKSIEQNPPGVPAPLNPVNQAAQDNVMAPQAGLPGGTTAPHDPSDAELIGRAAPTGALAMGALGATGALGHIGRYVAPIAASEAIRLGRDIPGIGKFIPPYSEFLPFIMGGGKGAAAQTAEEEAISAGRAAKIPTRLKPDQAAEFGESQLGRPGMPKIGAANKIPVTPGFSTPSVGQTERIPVRGMQPFGAGAAEGGGLPEPASKGVQYYPEPNAGPANEYVGSIPRPEVDQMAQRRVPGAVEHMVKLGKPSIVIPREGELPSGVRSSTILNEYGKPIEQSPDVERIEPIKRRKVENE